MLSHPRAHTHTYTHIRQRQLQFTRIPRYLSGDSTEHKRIAAYSYGGGSQQVPSGNTGPQVTLCRDTIDASTWLQTFMVENCRNPGDNTGLKIAHHIPQTQT
eukprot:scaffold147526_cov22-Tisochrysis_lutea.AAC.1